MSGYYIKLFPHWRLWFVAHTPTRHLVVKYQDKAQRRGHGVLYSELHGDKWCWSRRLWCVRVTLFRQNMEPAYASQSPR